MNEVKVVENTGGAMALPSSVMERLAKQAKDAAAKERPAIGRISLKSGVMSYAGQAMPGNKMEAIILVASYRNVFYAGRYDPNNIVSPNCFAIALSDEGMAPHENVSNPVHATCAGCANNEWESDPNGGRGKACKQTRRLVMLPATAIASVEAAQTAEMAVMDLPVTSVKNYSGFVNTLAASAGVPTYAAVTEISVVPDAKTQFKVKFQPMRVVPTEEILLAIEARLEQAQRLSTEAYEESAAPITPEEEAAPQTQGKSKTKKY